MPELFTDGPLGSKPFGGTWRHPDGVPGVLLVRSVRVEQLNNLRDSPILRLREQDVLHWLAQGFRYQDIADKLFISVETVRTHIRNIYEKLHARNRKEALKKVGLS